MKKTRSLNELAQMKMLRESMSRIEEDRETYDYKEDWEAEAESRGYEIEYWGNGSAHAYDDAGRDAGTWTAEFDTSSGRASGWFK